MFFRQIIHPQKFCLSYVIGCSGKGVCAVVDAQGNPRRYLEIGKRNGLKIAAVIETHIQADHLSSSRELARLAAAPLYFGPGADIHFPHKTLRDKQVLKVGDRKIIGIATPGHTPEHISLYVDNWFILTGDSLFVGDAGRVDLALEKNIDPATLYAKAAVLYQSLSKLKKLPAWTEIYPGHFRGSVCGKGMDGKMISTIGRELRTNDAFPLPRAKFIEYILSDQPPPPPGFKTIKRKNKEF